MPPSLSSQSLTQEREEAVQLWRGGGDGTRAADKETRVPFKNQLKILEVWKLVSLITSLLSSSKSDLMTRKEARVREATHALPCAWVLLTEPPEGDTHGAMNRRQETCKPTPVKIPT